MKLELHSASSSDSGPKADHLLVDEYLAEEGLSWGEVIQANNPPGDLPVEDDAPFSFTLGMMEEMQRWCNRAVPRSALYDSCRNTLHFYSARGITWRNTSDTPQWRTMKTRQRPPYRLRVWMSRNYSYTRMVLRESSFASLILPPMRVTPTEATKLLPPVVS